MKISRRDFLRASAAIVVAPGLRPTSARALVQALAGQGSQPVVWLQGQYCTGDSVSLLNSIHYATVDQVLLNSIDLKYHPTTMAAAGDLAVSAAETARAAGGYVLIVEGSIPTAENGAYCMVWENMTMQNALLTYSPNAAYILAVGTCASYGGIPAAAPNPTGATSVSGILGASNKIINIPGCPAHPDWIVGTVAHILTSGQPPALDGDRRPKSFFGKKIHDNCHERRRFCGEQHEAKQLGQPGCLKKLGCRGPETRADCFSRRNNAAASGRSGVNWCIGAGSPCIGCVEPSFPDGMSPFFR